MMEKFNIIDSNNFILNVDLIRYFEYNNSQYLIYSKGETDEKGYQKLYLSEVLEELGEPVIYNFDDDEWQNMQKIIKEVIKKIKSNDKDSIRDLDVQSINQIYVNEPRYFKLDKKLADILSSELEIDNDLSDEVQEEMLENIIIEPVDLPDDEIIELEGVEEIMNNVEPNNNNMVDNELQSIQNEKTEILQNVETQNVSENVNYKELYFAVKEEKEAMEAAFDEMLQELLKYKEKYGELN